MDKETIDRINALARKQRGEGLTEAEKTEQAALRSQYVEYIKAQVKDQLNAAGHHHHPDGCGCGCHHH